MIMQKYWQWVELDENLDETGYTVEFTEDETLYEVGEIDSWDGRTFKLVEEKH